MALPKAIQQQAELAEQLDAQIAAQTGQPPEQVSADAQAPVATTEAQAPAAPAQPAVEANPDAQPSGDEGKWERRYRSLQGKYDSEVPQLHSQLRAQGEQLQVVLQELQALRATKPVEPEKPLVSKEDETAFGADLIDLIRRVSAAQFEQLAARVMGKYEQQLQQMTDRVGTMAQVQNKTAEQRFWEDIAKDVPDWKDINSDPDFLEWLATIHPLVGAQYQAILANAQQQLNAQQVVAVFNEWKKLSGAQQTTTASDQADQTRRELESLAAPATSRATQPAAAPQSDKRIWTGAEYAAAYDPRAAKSKPIAEVEALRKAADLAVAEGRVRW
jgi:hypothetical protein